MELRNITTFLRVAELQNFTHAAEELGYSQSAVTVQIQQLEHELGVPLFERIGRTVHLTAPGQAFLREANEVMRAAERARDAVRLAPEPEGILRIGTMESLSASIISRLVGEYHKKFPLVKVVVYTERADGLLEMMRRNDVDFIYYIDAKHFSPDWVIPLDREEQIVFVAAPKNPLVGKQGIHLEKIITQPCVLTEEGQGYRIPFDQLLAERNLRVIPILEIGSTEVIVRMVEESNGVSLLPMYVVGEHLKSGRLVKLDVPEFSAAMHQQLVYHKNKWVTPQMQGFIDLIVQYVNRTQQ